MGNILTTTKKFDVSCSKCGFIKRVSSRSTVFFVCPICKHDELDLEEVD